MKFFLRSEVLKYFCVKKLLKNLYKFHEIAANVKNFTKKSFIFLHTIKSSYQLGKLHSEFSKLIYLFIVYLI